MIRQSRSHLRKYRRTIKQNEVGSQYGEINQNLPSNEEVDLEYSNVFSYPQDSNFNFHVSETSSAQLNDQYLNSFGDITENFDSVYSLNSRLAHQNNKQKSKGDHVSKPVRYTIKRDKDLRKKKQKGSAKQFSPQEDRQLLSHILKKGPKFHKFARYFPGKTTNMLNNRYYKTLRFNWSQIMGSQYAHLNAEIELQDNLPTQLIEEGEKNFYEYIPELKLFPQAEQLLVKFVSTLTKTFSLMKSGDVEEE